MLSVLVMPMCNGSCLVCKFITHWQKKKKELEEMKEMLFAKKEMSVLDSFLESQKTEIHELCSNVRMWCIKLHSVYTV